MEHVSIHYGACLYTLRSMPLYTTEHASVHYGNHKELGNYMLFVSY